MDNKHEIIRFPQYCKKNNNITKFHQQGFYKQRMKVNGIEVTLPDEVGSKTRLLRSVASDCLREGMALRIFSPKLELGRMMSKGNVGLSHTRYSQNSGNFIRRFTFSSFAAKHSTT